MLLQVLSKKETLQERRASRRNGGSAVVMQLVECASKIITLVNESL